MHLSHRFRVLGACFTVKNVTDRASRENQEGKIMNLIARFLYELNNLRIYQLNSETEKKITF